LADFGLSGPADKPTKNIYGNMAYMAPEVIRGGVYTVAADIYSIGMLMYELAAGHAPFQGIIQDVHLAFDICSGIRPTIPNGVPQDYQAMMTQCWDAEIENRPTIRELLRYFKNKVKENSSDSLVYQQSDLEISKIGATSSKSSLHPLYGDLPDSRNATIGELIICLFRYLKSINIPQSVIFR
jgi:serine/threonine protein kinase